MQSDRIGQTIGPYDDILTTVKKRKLKWFGHVSRLAKTIIQGTVQGGRRGRQKKRWTGLKFCNAVREAEKQNQMEGEGCYIRGALTVID